MTATAPPGLKISRIDFQGLIDSYFDDASRAESGPPSAPGRGAADFARALDCIER